MPDTDTAEKIATDATQEPPTEAVAAQLQAADAPPDGAAAAEPTAAKEKASAPAKSSREEQLERELRVSSGDQAAMRKDINRLTALLAAGDPEARKIARTADVKAARAEALALGQDQDEAERTVRKQHADDDVKAASETRQQEYKTRWDNATNEMGEALKAAGLTWDSTEVAEVREDWEGYWAEGRVTDARRLVRQVKAMKKAEPASANGGTPRKRTAQQRSDDEDDDGGPSGGAATAGLASYTRRLKEGKELPSSEEIDRLTARFLSGG